MSPRILRRPVDFGTKGPLEIRIGDHQHSFAGRIKELLYSGSLIVVLHLDADGGFPKGNVVAFSADAGTMVWRLSPQSDYTGVWVDEKEQLVAYDASAAAAMIVDPATGALRPRTPGVRPW
jgi:multisubunit Na+/H+ antiporter MnhB subunit